MRRLDSEKVIECLSTLGLDSKETISSQKLQLKFDKFERLYGPDNKLTANVEKFAEAQSAFNFLKANIYNVNLMIQNNFNEEDYEIALQHVEEQQQRAHKEGAAVKRQIKRENKEVDEAILKAREAAVVEEAREFYSAYIEREMKPYSLSYSEYSKKGNAKLDSICAEYKNKVENITNKDEAKEMILACRSELAQVLKRKEEKRFNKNFIIYSVVVAIFLLVSFGLPLLIKFTDHQGNIESYNRAIERMKTGDCTEAQYMLTHVQDDIDVRKPLGVCNGMILLNKSMYKYEKDYIVDGINTILSTETKVNIYYDYKQCSLKSLLVNQKAIDNFESEYKDLYTPQIYGYNFSGWLVNQIEYIDDEVNVTFVAQLSKITYYITYDLDGGYIPYSSSFYSNNGHPTSYNIESNITLTAPQKDGFAYGCWIDELGNVVKTIAPGTTGDKTLTAYYYN